MKILAVLAFMPLRPLAGVGADYLGVPLSEELAVSCSCPLKLKFVISSSHASDKVTQGYGAGSGDKTRSSSSCSSLAILGIILLGSACCWSSARLLGYFFLDGWYRCSFVHGPAWYVTIECFTFALIWLGALGLSARLPGSSLWYLVFYLAQS